MDPNPPPVATVEDSAVPFPQRLPRVPMLVPPPESLPPAVPAQQQTVNVQPANGSGGLLGKDVRWGQLTGIAIIFTLFPVLMGFILEMNRSQHKDMMNFIIDTNKSDRERQERDIHTLIAPMENVVREMKDGRSEQREIQRGNDAKFEKQHEKLSQILDQNRATLDELRKMKMP